MVHNPTNPQLYRRTIAKTKNMGFTYKSKLDNDRYRPDQSPIAKKHNICSRTFEKQRIHIFINRSNTKGSKN